MRLTEHERETLCERMHDAYEAAAVEEGWETQARSRVPWADVPEANKATMRAAVEAAIVPILTARLAAVEALADEWEGWASGRSTPRIDAFRDAAAALRAALTPEATP